MEARTNADIAKLAEYELDLRIANANRAAHEKTRGGVEIGHEHEC